MQTWQTIENEEDYRQVVAHYEVIRGAEKGSPEHDEWLHLAFLIHKYEEKQWEMPNIDPAELRKLRKQVFEE